MKVGPLVSSLFTVHKSSDSLCQLGLKTRLFIGGVVGGGVSIEIREQEEESGIRMVYIVLC